MLFNVLRVRRLKRYICMYILIYASKFFGEQMDVRELLQSTPPSKGITRNIKYLLCKSLISRVLGCRDTDPQTSKGNIVQGLKLKKKEAIREVRKVAEKTDRMILLNIFKVIFINIRLSFTQKSQINCGRLEDHRGCTAHKAA